MTKQSKVMPTKVRTMESYGLWSARLRKLILRNLMASGFAFAILSGSGGAVAIPDQSPDVSIRKVAYAHLSARVLHLACYYKRPAA